MALKKAKWLVFALTLLLGGQAIFALGASCPASPRDNHRCCLERRAPAVQVKTAPPCGHCFEKAAPTVLLQPAQSWVLVAAFLPQSDFPRWEKPFVQKDYFSRFGNLFLPQPDIPILLRQILV